MKNCIFEFCAIDGGKCACFLKALYQLISKPGDSCMVHLNPVTKQARNPGSSGRRWRTTPGKGDKARVSVSGERICTFASIANPAAAGTGVSSFIDRRGRNGVLYQIRLGSQSLLRRKIAPQPFLGGVRSARPVEFACLNLADRPCRARLQLELPLRRLHNRD